MELQAYHNEVTGLHPKEAPIHFSSLTEASVVLFSLVTYMAHPTNLPLQGYFKSCNELFIVVLVSYVNRHISNAVVMAQLVKYR